MARSLDQPAGIKILHLCKQWTLAIANSSAATNKWIKCELLQAGLFGREFVADCFSKAAGLWSLTRPLKRRRFKASQTERISKSETPIKWTASCFG